ncbi:hypothetical protein D3C87_1703460 [compost metagenome]
MLIVDSPACKGGNGARRRDLTDAVVIGVGDEDVAAGINGDPRGVVEESVRAGGINVTGTVPREGGHGTCRSDLADTMVSGVGYPKVSTCIQGDARGALELGAGARSIR